MKNYIYSEKGFSETINGKTNSKREILEFKNNKGSYKKFKNNKIVNKKLNITKSEFDTYLKSKSQKKHISNDTFDRAMGTFNFILNNILIHNNLNTVSEDPDFKDLVRPLSEQV